MEEELPTYLSSRLAKAAARRGGWAVDHLVPRLAVANVAISKNAVSALRRVGARRVTHLPPGIDLGDLRGADAPRAVQRWGLDDRPWVVYTGNADPYQDLGVWFRAMALVPGAGLLMVSGSPLPTWRRLASELRLAPGRVRLVQSTRLSDHLDALAVATVAVLPRSQCAGFPIKLLNYLGMGVPTVAARGSAQAMGGVVPFDNDDPRDMARAIRTLLDQAGARRALGEAGRTEVEERWTWDAVALRLEELYRALLDAPRPR